jgi:hypothetical protein
MSITNVKKNLKLKRQRNYLARDFDSFRTELLQYAQTYFPDKIQDFSEASVGGMLLDLVAFVGDTTSFYLDHQFNELRLDTAVERKNVERLVRLTGTKVKGASPAYCDVNFTFRVDSELIDGGYYPKNAQLPIVRSGTTVRSNTGINFTLSNDVDFSETNSRDEYIATYTIAATGSDGNPTSYLVTRSGTCASGNTSEESFTFGSDLTPFKTITLNNPNVSEIILVKDSEGNDYYEVDTLAQDTVFLATRNLGDDSDVVDDSLAVVPAPYRFVSRATIDSGVVTLVFGSGNANSLDNDILPDPSEVAVPLFGDRRSFSRSSIDPNTLLNSQSLGITPINTTIRVRYRHGGGVSHNVASNTIKTVTNLITVFNETTSPTKVAAIRSSITVNNVASAAGGENAPTLEELRAIALDVRNAQNRIVTKEDLLARVYTMPTNFGRAFRIGISPNPVNPLSSILFVISRDKDGYLTQSPDALKRNISTYLNEFRVISDAFDVLDARVINIGFRYTVVVDPREDKSAIITRINNSLAEYMSTSNMNINGSIQVADVINLIINQDGVTSLENYKFVIKSETETGSSTRTYSGFSADLTIRRGALTPPTGGIFEVKYPDNDIVGNAI